MGNTAFDEWYDGWVGFHINSERILEEINNSIIITNHQVTVDPTVFRKWMEVCWNNALDNQPVT